MYAFHTEYDDALKVMCSAEFKRFQRFVSYTTASYTTPLHILLLKYAVIAVPWVILV